MSTNDNRAEAKKRTEMLVSLREHHAEEVKKAQALLKDQQAVRKTLLAALKTSPQSVPQLAAATGLASQAVLWHVTAMKKYGVLEEVGMDDEEAYYLYGLTKEARS
jgi:biotin operon repressor